MADLKIPAGPPGPITVGIGAGGVQVKVDAPPVAPQEPVDAFKGEAPPGGETVQLTGQALAQGPALPAFALAGDAKQIQNPAEALEQFQNAFAALKDQLLEPGLPPDIQGQRANEFFTEFAKAFVETSEQPQPPPEAQAPPPEQRDAAAERPPEQQQAPQERQENAEQRQLAREFADSLKQLGFMALKNLANGKDGVENAFQLLTSEGLKQFAEQAKEQKIVVQGEFPPRPPGEAGAEKQQVGEGPSQLDEQAAAEPGGNQDEGVQLPPDAEGVPVPENEEDVLEAKERKRGKTIFARWMDTFRRNDETVRKAEEKWDRTVVAALLALLFLVLVTIALVSL